MHENNSSAEEIINKLGIKLEGIDIALKDADNQGYGIIEGYYDTMHDGNDIWITGTNYLIVNLLKNAVSTVIEKSEMKRYTTKVLKIIPLPDNFVLAEVVYSGYK